MTDGLSDAASPAFDASGKYLYFTASTDIGPAVFGFDMSSYPHRPTRSVYVCVLRKDLSSPLAPESDEEKVIEEKKDEAPKPPPKKEPVVVTIDFRQHQPAHPCLTGSGAQLRWHHCRQGRCALHR